MKCRHLVVQLWWRWFGTWIDRRPRLCREDHDRATCVSCGAWLSLGPSNDDSDQVRVEMRAAELASAWKPKGGVRHLRPTMAEKTGWRYWPYRSPTSDGERAGFLAAAIVAHEEGQ